MIFPLKLSFVFVLIFFKVNSKAIDDVTLGLGLEGKDFFQGDIVLTPEQKEWFSSDSELSSGKGSRTGLLNEYYRWPKNSQRNVVVTYNFYPGYFNDAEKQKIRSAMNYIESLTCVRFVERTNQRDYVAIYSGTGCWSYMGKLGGLQYMSLQKNGCLSQGTIVHELIHLLGYDHMHNHADRDSYLYINLNNVEPQYRYAFDKVNPRATSNFGTPYDYYSVMHYYSTAFSRNGLPTMIPRNSQFTNIIGRTEIMSSGDVARIKNMYKC